MDTGYRSDGGDENSGDMEGGEVTTSRGYDFDVAPNGDGEYELTDFKDFEGSVYYLTRDDLIQMLASIEQEGV